MKKFEEELKNGPVMIDKDNVTGVPIYDEGTIISYFNDWVSPEDHQAEIEKIKSQLEKQQPEIPEFVANHIEATKEDFWTMLSAMDDSNLSSRLVDWLKGGNFRNQEIFAQAWLNGYTVAKEKRFYLKNKLTGKYLYESKKGFFEQERLALELTSRCDYTQQEIDSMAADSYEKIEVGDD